MVYYNWRTIYREGKGSGRECWRIFKMLAEGQIPQNMKDPIYKYKEKENIFVGQSFIVNDSALIRNESKYSEKELAIYLALASYRSLAEYISFNKISLDTIKLRIPEDLYIKNRLILVDKSLIRFKYEEQVTKGK